MAEYGIYDNDVITNVIIADTQQIAESVSGMSAVEVINGRPNLGWVLTSNGWRLPQPYPSWSWDDEEGVWNPPVPRPDGIYEWDEEKQEWIPAVT